MSPARRHRVVTAMAVVLVGAAAVVAVATWRTSTARVSATTENPGNRWSAGTIELGSDGSSRLALNSIDIWPGRRVQDCVVVSYLGSIADVDVRVFGQVEGGTGLEDHLTATIEVGRGGAAGDCAGFAPGPGPATSRNLARLAAATYETAPSVLPDAQPGDEVSLRITLEVADDNAAQGLTSDFWLVLEARP